MHAQLDLPKDDGEQHPEKHWSVPQSTEEIAADDAPEDPVALQLSTVPAKIDVDVLVSQRHTRPSAELVALRKAAVTHFNDWKKEFLVKLKEILSKADDAETLDLRQKRKDKMAQVKADTPAEGEELLNVSDGPNATNTNQHNAKEVEDLQAIYHPIPTRLTTVPVEDRIEVLSAVIILLLSTGSYSAYSRTFATYLASAFGLPPSSFITEEKEIAKTMIQASTEAEKAKENGQMSAEAEAEKRKQQNQTSRFWKVGLASVAGAALIGVTGGLAAPVVAGAIGGLMGSVGLGGLASFLGIFWMNGALVGTLFGAFGARMTVSPHSYDFNIS